MGKKYSPSGYQIIDIKISQDVTSGATITATTEDEKILCKLLSGLSMSKPVLLTIDFEPDTAILSGFGVRWNRNLILNVLSGYYIRFIYASDNSYRVLFEY